jgi:predicted fused transcriptional regulator/phosphomethylpyrimidine kinase
VRGGPATVQALRKSRLGWVEVARRAADEGEAAFARAAAKDPTAILFHDAGAVGIEPCLYVAGADARTAARRILQVARGNA